MAAIGLVHCAQTVATTETLGAPAGAEPLEAAAAETLRLSEAPG
jgi:hypothetical protein